MSTPTLSPYPLPSADEIEAAIRRARQERSLAVGRFFAALFSRRKAAADENLPQSALKAGARC
jgi:hypothetical protein